VIDAALKKSKITLIFYIFGIENYLIVNVILRGFKMISKNIQTALNKQLNAEYYSSYFYLSMSAYFEANDLQGFAKWFRMQADEEYAHAMKIFDYVYQVGGEVALQKIDGPKTKWNSFLEVFKDTFVHEQKVTKSINTIVDLAQKEKDHATVNFLQWFVGEQVEEEATAQQNVKRMEMIGDSKSGLFMLDNELGSRTAQQPATE
jgi:ferritin